MSDATIAALDQPGPIALPRGWTARLDLEFEDRAGQTFLAKRSHFGPLLVQRPFFPEPKTCHVYVVHPPGGIVGGDDLTISIRAHQHSHALLTTPAATKFYRCQDAIARQRQVLHARSATIEWLPQESIFYCDADARSDTIVHLSRDSRFIGWEIPCLGLPARAEAFKSGSLRLGMEVWVDDTPRFIDRLLIDGESKARTAQWGLGGFESIGTMLAYPATAATLAAARTIETPGVEFAVTLVDDVLVCRSLGAQAEAVKRALLSVWQTIRPLILDRPAVLPRIWAT